MSLWFIYPFFEKEILSNFQGLASIKILNLNVDRNQ